MDDTGAVTGDNHTFSYSFVGPGGRLETLGIRNASHNDDTVPYAWLAWNNRPFANHMEIANVPTLSAEGLIRHFGETEADDSPSIGTDESADRSFSYFFGDDDFGHLLGFGGVQRSGGTGWSSSNPTDLITSSILSKSRIDFLGSETYLPGNVSGSRTFVVQSQRSVPFDPEFPLSREELI